MINTKREDMRLYTVLDSDDADVVVFEKDGERQVWESRNKVVVQEGNGSCVEHDIRCLSPIEDSGFGDISLMECCFSCGYVFAVQLERIN